MYTLEYSLKQDCFHIDKLENTIRINILNAINKRENDYRIVFIHPNYDILNKVREFIEDKTDIPELDKILEELNIRKSE